MSLREVEFILGGNETISTRVLVDESSTVFEAMTRSGLLPRDGSLRYAMDRKGNSLNHQTIGDAPQKIRLGMLKQVESVWGEVNANGPFVGSERLDGTKLLIPGIEISEYTNVFITQRKQKESSFAYRFRTENKPYMNGDLVFVRAPLEGNEVSLFDPKTGKEDIRVTYQFPNLHLIRGFWGCCEVRYNAGKGSVVFRPDLSPVPINFKPISKKNIKTVFKKNTNQKKKSQKSLVRCTLKTPSTLKVGQSIFKGSVKQPAGGWQRALITGNLPKKGPSCEGVLVRFAGKNSPALVNLPYYRDGQHLFCKIPETGESTELFNLHHPESPIRMPFIVQQSFNGDVKGRWVVAKISRNTSGKRILIVEGTPKSHPSCQI